MESKEESYCSLFTVKRKEKAMELLKIHRNTSDLFPRDQKGNLKIAINMVVVYILSMSKVVEIFGPKLKQSKIKLCRNNNIFQERFFLEMQKNG